MSTVKSVRFVRFIAKTGIIAALYATLTLVLYPVSYGAVQFRLSEALTVLPFFMPEAIPGLFIGCIVSNIMSPNIAILDVVFGSLATLASALATSRIKYKWLAPLPPVLINAVVVGLVITFSSMSAEGGAFLFMLLYNCATVGLGQLVVCYGFGMPLMYAVDRLGLMNTNK